MTLDEAKNALLINKNQLDTECINYAMILNQVGVEAAMAISERDEAKINMDKKYVEIAKTKREHAERTGEKITEAKLDQMVQNDIHYQEKQNIFLAAKLNADLWYAMKDSFSQRGKMIVELCSLYLSGYFGEVVVKNSNAEETQYSTTKRRISVERERRKK